MDDFSAIMKTALEHQHKGRLEEAEKIFRTVLEIEPFHADTLHRLGLIHHAQGKYKEAAEIIGKAIIQSPKVADYHSNLAAAQLATGHPKSALSHASRAIELEINLGEAHYNLGNALFALGKTDDAVRSFQQAIDKDPTNNQFWSNYLFALNFAPSASQELVFEENRRWGVLLEQDKHILPFRNDWTSDRQLRTAYYLPELDRHVTTRFLDAMLEYHNRDEFEVTIYGYAQDHSPAPKSLLTYIDAWIDIGQMNIDLVAEQMRRDQIDILIHPCTFKARYRMLIAYNPAPVQIACINLVSTTGLRNTTHLVTDSFLTPPGKSEDYYTENLIRLSGLNVYRKPMAAPDVSPLPANHNGFVVFGSLNNPAKLTPECISLWTQILQQVPSSRLLLKHQSFESTEICESFATHFKKAGISKERLIFRGYSLDGSEYLCTYNQIDIALDPLPFGGGTTTYESIWMGVPVITMVGDGIMGRLTGSMMTRLGYADFVTTSPEAYVSVAKEFAFDLAKLSKIRHNLRESASKSIFDGQQYVRELEGACREIWINHCENV